MDGERKIYLSEGVPLNSGGAANIFLNTGKPPKANSPDGTVIHLKTEKPSDLGVHINTTFSITSSKKIKVLFLLNFLLSVICIVLSCSIGFYYWNELISMRKQLDMMKDHLLVPSLNQDKVVQSALIGQPRLPETREPRVIEDSYGSKAPESPKRLYVEDLGDDIHLVDIKKKNTTDNKTVSLAQKEITVIQFNGAITEINLGKDPFIGPWVLDEEVSSKNSDNVIGMNEDYFTVKEGGLYLVYAQVVYMSQAPNCFFIWAKQKSDAPRLLSACATGDISTSRPLEKSQMSCSTQTVARLYKNDIVKLGQREPNRTLWLRPGYTHLGFIKLSS